ncbi:MAG: low temperature requirement protein A [Mycobacteriaceae bacterium]
MTNSLPTPIHQSRFQLRWPARAWQDLYYDLALVAAIIVMSTVYSYDYSFEQAAWLSLVFSAIWLLWLITNLASSFCPSSGTRVAVYVCQMTLILSAAILADDTIEDNSGLVGPVLAIAIFTITWLLRNTPNGICFRKAKITAGNALLLAAVIFLLSPLHFSIYTFFSAWIISLSLMTYAVWQLLSHPVNNTAAQTHNSHLGHRLGELSTVVFGESFVKLGLVAGESGLEEVNMLAVIPVFILITALWWDYFVGSTQTNPPTKGTRELYWLTAHLPLHLAIVALAVAAGKLLVSAKAIEGGGSNQFFIIPIFLAYTGFILIDWASGTASKRAVITHSALAITALACALLLYLISPPPAWIIAGLLMVITMGASMCIASTPSGQRSSS